MWCVHLNLSWQTETILTRSKLSKMHLLLDPLQVRRSTTGTWYSPHQTYFGMAVLPEWCFYVQNQVKWWAKPLWFPTLCTLFLGESTLRCYKKSPVSLDLLTQESMRQLRSLVSIGISVYLWVLSANTVPWHQTVRQIQCGSWWCYLLMMWASPCSVFVMLEEGEWRRTSTVWRLPSS